MTNCPGSESIAAYADGHLEESESALLLEHCAECEDCRRELAILTQAHPARPVPTPLEARTVKSILRALERERDRTPLRLRAVAHHRSRPGINGAAAAAIIATVGIMILLLQSRGAETPEKPKIVRQVLPQPPGSNPLPPEAPVPVPAPPRGEEPPSRRDPVQPPPVPQPKTPEKPDRVPDPIPEPIVPAPPPKLEETRPEEAPARPSHTVVARALSEVQVTDVTGTVSVRRKGAKEKEILGPVARLSEGDVVTTSKGASFQIEGRHPVVLGENTSVTLAYSAQDQAPYVQIRSGEAMVDSTGPTHWVVSDGRVALVIKQARARFSTTPGEDRLRVSALSEPIVVQPDGGQVLALRVGEELQVGRAMADLRPLDPQAVAKKLAAFDLARPRQRTIFYTSCDPADARRGHFFLQEGLWFRNEALQSHEAKEKTVAAAISPNPRFTWRDTLVVRFRFMTNAREMQLALRVDEKKFSLLKTFTVERKNVNQWISADVPLALTNLGFRRDDGQLQLVVSSADKFDSIRFSARQQDVFGDQKAYILIDDIQVVEKEKE